MFDPMLPSLLAVNASSVETVFGVLKELFHMIVTAVMHTILLPFVHGGFIAVAKHLNHEAGSKVEHIADDIAEEAASLVADVAKEVV